MFFGVHGRRNALGRVGKFFALRLLLLRTGRSRGWRPEDIRASKRSGVGRAYRLGPRSFNKPPEAPTMQLRFWPMVPALKAKDAPVIPGKVLELAGGCGNTPWSIVAAQFEASIPDQAVAVLENPAFRRPTRCPGPAASQNRRAVLRPPSRHASGCRIADSASIPSKFANRSAVSPLIASFSFFLFLFPPPGPTAHAVIDASNKEPNSLG